MKSFDAVLIQAKKDNVHCLNVAAVIINKDNKLLLCKRAIYKKIAPGVWHIPGGKVETGETIADAITRELAEELSLKTIEVHSFSGVTRDYEVDKKIHRTAFILVQVQGEIILNKENSAYVFTSIEEIGRYVSVDELSHIQKNLEYAIRSNIYSNVQ